MSETFFPFASLAAGQRELGLVVSLLLGFGFGFVLERAGFGRADKLAAQFYLHDMTVFKVMFSAIVTAMLGVVLASGLGLADLRGLSEGAASETFLVSMIVGGLLLGAGFIISGYCPGTSLVAAASGHLDGLMTVLGVMAGSLLFSEAYPLLGKLAGLGGKGHFFLYDLFGIPPAVLALLVAVMAIGMFLGAERVEAVFARRRGLAAAAPARRGGRLVFAGLGTAALLGLAFTALPQTPAAAPVKRAQPITQEDLARRIVERPWSVRVLDLRPEAACQKQRIPGAECAPGKSVEQLGLGFAPADRDLILVGEGTLAQPPVAALAYGGQVRVLEGGFRGWQRFALEKPAPPAAGASRAALEAYAFRAALHSALTGQKAAPPPPSGVKGYTPGPRKKKAGGCSG